MSNATRTAAAIDTELAETEYKAMVLIDRINGMTATIEKIEAGERGYTWMAGSVDEKRAEVAKNRAELAPLRKTIDAGNEEFAARGGWTRYFLVHNSNGHVHRERSCSTCFTTTQYLWITDLSDCDETKMVEQYGSDACTICFPNAPTLPGFATSRTSKEKADRKAAREAKVAEKAAKEEAKKIANPDGSKVIDCHGGEIRTDRDAKMSATDYAADLARGSDYFDRLRPNLERDVTDAFARITVALAAKFETTPEHEAAEAGKRAKRRR